MLIDLKIEHPGYFQKITAIFLIATPSQGSQIANWISSLSKVVGRLIVDLQTKDINTYLQNLENQWQTILRQRENKYPRIYGAYEKKSIMALKVVSEVYTATLYDETPIAENFDHINIVKPKSTHDSIYKWVRGRIASVQKELTYKIPEKIYNEILDQTNILEEKTQNFVGRNFVFDAIEQFITTNPRGYFIVCGDPGIGKSALAAQFVKKKNCVYHFNIRAEGINKALNFLTNICAQLIAAYKLDYQILPPETSQNSVFLSKLLGQISEKLGNNEKLIIVVDALDEVDTDVTTGANVLYLPMTLPIGVYIVATMCRDIAVKLRIECEQQLFEILQDDAKNLADINKYIKNVSEREGIQTYISKQEIDNKIFIVQLTDKSQGNFIYLRYVIPEIERGAYTDLALAAIPLGLKNYYEDHWGRMRGQDEEAWFKYKLPVVIALTLVKEAISINLIADFSKVPEKDRIRSVLKQWQQFLYESQVAYQGGLQTRYRMYHASFHDFLAKKEEIADEHVDLIAAHGQIADTMWDDLFDE